MWRFHVFGEDNRVITASDFIYNSQQEALRAANEYVKRAVPRGEVWKVKTSQKWTGGWDWLIINISVRHQRQEQD